MDFYVQKKNPKILDKKIQIFLCSKNGKKNPKKNPEKNPEKNLEKNPKNNPDFFLTFLDGRRIEQMLLFLLISCDI